MLDLGCYTAAARGNQRVAAHQVEPDIARCSDADPVAAAADIAPFGQASNSVLVRESQSHVGILKPDNSSPTFRLRT